MVVQTPVTIPIIETIGVKQSHRKSQTKNHTDLKQQQTRKTQSKNKSATTDTLVKEERSTSPRHVGNNNIAKLETASPKKKTRSHYEDHLSAREVQQGLEQGSLVKGHIRINPFNRSEAYVTVQGAEKDIFLNGEATRNRALEGDLVAVQLDPEKKWRKREGNEIQPTGKVVAIIEKLRKQNIVGVLKASREDNAIHSDDQFVVFVPLDKRYPRMLIPIGECSKDFIANPLGYRDELFVSTVLKWTTTSASPLGKLRDHIGTIGDFNTEIDSLLIQHDISREDFSETVYSEINRFGLSDKWRIPQNEISIRSDLRGKRIFSIDPEACRDVDDAMSIEQLEDDIFELGVHIADVSYFVQPNTSLDMEARSRATSVYLVNKVIPMLPALLSENLCSLNQGVDRLAFSVFVRVNKMGDVLSGTNSVRFEKSVIHNCAKMSYESAEDIISGVVQSESDMSVRPVNGQSGDALIKDITLLSQITSQMRQKRFSKGLLNLINNELTYHFDENKQPSHIAEKVTLDSCKMVEELMLLANFLVAEALLTSSDARIKDSALLRNHKAPLMQRLSEFEKFCTEVAKIPVNIESVTTLNSDLHRVYADNQTLGTILFSQVRRAMQHADYVRSPLKQQADQTELLYHYGLNVPYYTHFTSPIRRYADLTVHRLMTSVVTGSSFVHTTEEVERIADNCNIKRLDAKKVQEQSQKAFLCCIYSKPNQKHIQNGIICGVSQKNLTIYFPKISAELRVPFDDVQHLIQRRTYDRKNKAMVLTWLDAEKPKTTFSLFDNIECELFTKQSDTESLFEIAARLSF